MDWNTFFGSRRFRTGLSVLLVLAIIQALCWPGLQLKLREPENPLTDGGASQLQPLELGRDEGSSERTEASQEEPTEQTQPDQTEPENTEPGENREDTPGQEDDADREGTGEPEDGESDSGTADPDAEPPEVALSFVWQGNKTGEQVLICTPGATVSDTVRTVELSAGGITYAMTLTGTDSSQGRITRVTCLSQAGENVSLNKDSGKLTMKLPDGQTSNSYCLTVTALVKGEYVTFTVYLYLTYDVRLQMRYRVDGTMQTVTCETGRETTAETVYDDQLDGGLLEYEMTLIGSQAGNLTMQTVTCYHSGSSRTETLSATGSTILLLKNGKTGENTFTARAVDTEGNVYTFTLNIPYKHRGENAVQIYSSLENGDRVYNGTGNSLTVYAYSSEANAYIFNGTDSRLRVELDGTVVSGLKNQKGYEYTLYPDNPVTGDTNTHTLYIYAEDAYGNFGELTLTLNGRRNEPGQKIGTATVRIDLTTLGLGVVESVRYDVLADEPVSYVVEKAVGGKDMGALFGSASDTLGWTVKYGGTYDVGYYLRSISTGYTPNALEGSSWPGTTEEEILAAIDARFGQGTGLATLWRCIYRNGLNKSSGSGGTIGEFDYTSGSGWMYAIGSSYYPGQSMSQVYLKDGDTLTLRFTLAYGWDIGGGSTGYGNSVGYCVTAVNGSFHIQHQMETVTNEDGTVSYVCHCCGLVEECSHGHTTCRDLQDGTHALYCEDCKTAIGDVEEHIWDTASGDADCHICGSCGSAETHIWQEVAGSSTATCTESGVKTVKCAICGMERQVTAAARGHTYNNRWNYTSAGHYRICSVCGEKIDEGTHTYVYDGDWDDYECSVCGVLHDWEVECSGNMTIVSATCQKIIYSCDGCGCKLTKYGDFEQYHSYVNGICQHCGREDPEYVPEETEPEPTGE